MAYLRKYRGGKIDHDRDEIPPDVEIVAFIVRLARSGNFSANQIKGEVRKEFFEASTRLINSSLKDAQRRLLKAHEES